MILVLTYLGLWITSFASNWSNRNISLLAICTQSIKMKSEHDSNMVQKKPVLILDLVLSGHFLQDLEKEFCSWFKIVFVLKFKFHLAHIVKYFFFSYFHHFLITKHILYIIFPSFSSTKEFIKIVSCYFPHECYFTQWVCDTDVYINIHGN